MTAKNANHWDRPARVVVIGGSAGSIDALGEIVRTWSADFALPVLVVLHLPPDSKSLLPEIFSAKAKAPLHEVFDKTPLRPGIFFAPPNYHLQIERDGRLSLSVDDMVNYSRPSIDVLFSSAAAAFGDEVVAVVLSGSNDDGAAGAAAIHTEGGRVLIQDPETASISYMPTATLRRVPLARPLAPSALGGFLAGLQPVAALNPKQSSGSSTP